LGPRGTPPPQPLPPEITPDALNSTPNWWLILRLLLMWGFVVAVIALVLYIYFRDRSLPRTGMRRFFNWLNLVARSLWMWWRRVQARTSLTWNQIRAALSPRLNEPKSGAGMSLLEARTPRARIR